MAATVNQWSTVPSPLSNAIDWTIGQRAVLRDNGGANNLVMIRPDTNGTGVSVYTSTDNATFARVASDATNPDTSGCNLILDITQDAAGKVHAIAVAQSWTGSLNHYLMRFALVRDGSGNVTGITYEQTPFALTDHGRTGFDFRAQIHVRNHGTLGETLVYTLGENTNGTNDDLHRYAARSTTMTPSSSSHFLGLGGTGSDTEIFTSTGNVYGSNHVRAGLLAWIGSNGDMWDIVGPLNADLALGPGGADVTVFDITGQRWVETSTGWTTSGSRVVIVAASSSTVIPNLCSIYGTSSKVWAMYSEGTKGISFSHVDSAGTWTIDALPSPRNTANRCGDGTFVATDDDKVHAIYNTYGTYSTPAAAGDFASWNGSTWSITNDSNPKMCLAIFGVSGWSWGCCAIRVNGDPVAQQDDGDATSQPNGTLDVATVYQFPGPIITQQPSNQAGQPGGTVTFNAAATSSGGTLVAQWQSSSDGGATPVDIGGATSTTSYSATSVLLTDNGKLIRAQYTDDNGSSYTSWATLQVAAVGPRTDASFGAAQFGGGAFGAASINGTASTTVNASGPGVTDSATAATGSASGGAQASGAGVTDAATAATGTATGGAQASGAGVTDAATAANGSATGSAQASGAGATATATAATGSAGAGVVASGPGVTDSATAATGSASGGAQASGAGVTDAATAATGTAIGGAQASGAGVTDAATAASGSATGSAQASGAGATATATAATGTAGAGVVASGPGVTNNATAASGSATGSAQASGAGVTDSATAANGSAAGAAQASGAGATATATAATGTASTMTTPLYATSNGMVLRFGAREMIELTTRSEGTAIDVVVMTAALLKADAVINGYLQGRYALPLSNVPVILVTYACDIARYYLYADAVTEQVTKRYKSAIKFLSMVADGRMNLGVSTAGQPAASAASVTADGIRTFTQDTLRDFNT